jgi:hypothetical protein
MSAPVISEEGYRWPVEHSISARKPHAAQGHTEGVGCAGQLGQ